MVRSVEVVFVLTWSFTLERILVLTLLYVIPETSRMCLRTVELT